MTYSEIMQEAASLHRSGRLNDAQARYQAALALDPQDFAALYYLGLVSAQQGRAEEAIALFRRALERNSRAAEVHSNLGMALHSLRRDSEAVPCYERAIHLNPRYAVAYSNLGTALGALGRHNEAVDQFESALAIKPDFIEARNNLGVEQYALGAYAAAALSFGKALAARPDFIDAQVNLGNTLLALERPREALKSYERALALQPRSQHLRLLIGDVLQSINQPLQAIAQYEYAVALEPHAIEARMKLGNILQVENRHGAALAWYRQVLSDQPDCAEAYDCIGFALAELGNSQDARQAFEAALRIEPARAKSYFGLVNLAKVARDEPHLPALRALASNIESLAPEAQTIVHFAWGKACSDLADYPQSFAHIAAGNALRRREIPYDESVALDLFERMGRAFSTQLLSDKGGSGSTSQKPIFILGMMRSGTTLVEQLLASHPRVCGAGERLDLRLAVQDILGANADIGALPEFAAGLTAASLARIATAYLGRLEAVAEGAGRGDAIRITDKLPANFLLIGLIALALPQARIIHTCRDPIDTCLSCFANLFANNQPHTYDLAELGRYYRSYARLMAHWREVLPPGAMLEVHYEDLVGDFEGNARRIVEYCGLEWDEACLAFQKTERPVRTASMSQVRQPVYRSSVGRERPDAAQLRPLLDALGP